MHGRTRQVGRREEEWRRVCDSAQVVQCRLLRPLHTSSTKASKPSSLSQADETLNCRPRQAEFSGTQVLAHSTYACGRPVSLACCLSWEARVYIRSDTCLRSSAPQTSSSRAVVGEVDACKHQRAAWLGASPVSQSATGWEGGRYEREDAACERVCVGGATMDGTVFPMSGRAREGAASRERRRNCLRIDGWEGGRAGPRVLEARYRLLACMYSTAQQGEC